MTTKDIQELLCKREIEKFNLPCENVKNLFSAYEIDVLSLNKSGYLTEFEVKISRSDFLADVKKSKWKFYKSKCENLISNYFYYVCPENLISTHEIPDFSGLVYIVNDKIEVIKKAPLIHRSKKNKVDVLTKFCRVSSERIYLGSCRLTIKNKLIHEKKRKKRKLQTR